MRKLKCVTCGRKMKLVKGTKNQWYCPEWEEIIHRLDAEK